MIYVNIASYRDPECEPTVDDLFAKARHPEQLRVTVVLQSLPSDDLVFHRPRTRILSVDATESKGVCWARHLGYRLYDGEAYVLQIDSHMRFVEHWDVRLIAQLKQCRVPKPLLSTYPAHYDPPNVLQRGPPGYLSAVEFMPNGLLRLIAVPKREPQTIPQPSAFVAAGFLFGDARWISDCPYDSSLYFHGEEISLATRLWSHGWDFFGPSEHLTYHRYLTGAQPAQRRLHWEDAPDWQDLEQASLRRVKSLLNGDPIVPPYGLGRTRSLAQYQRFAGVDFRRQTIAEFARKGEFSC